MDNVKQSKKYFIIAEIVMLLSAMILFRAIKWSHISSVKRIVFDIIVLAVMLAIPFLLCKNQYLISRFFVIENKIRGFGKKYRKKNIIFIGVCVIGSIFLVVTGKYYLHLSGYKIKFWEVIFLLLLGVMIYHEMFYKKIHLFFFCSMLLIGLLYVCEYPSIVGISWDDEIHYARALKLADAFDGVSYEADYKIISEYADNIYSHNCYDAESRAAYMKKVEKVYAEKAISETHLGTFGIYSISYIPSAIGIVLARGLGLNFRHMFMLGKFFNLLMYVVLVTLAIRKTPYGKVLMTVIGMIPTMMFMAASYSYDPWVLSWTLLGYAYFIGVISETQQTNSKESIISAICITIGCLPKAVYFPLLFPLLFIGKKNIKNEKERKNVKIIVGICILILVGSFLLPMLVHGAGVGDVRGGGEVNATEQIKYVLQHPLQYCAIWFKFIVSYIGVENCRNLVSFSYAGWGECYGLSIAVILVVGVLDRIGTKDNRIVIKCATVLSIIMVLGLVPTALYISFTAVASPTIAGCQFRYILPVVFPALLLSFSDNIENKMNIELFRLIPMGLMSFVLLYSLYMNMVCLL